MTLRKRLLVTCLNHALFGCALSLGLAAGSAMAAEDASADGSESVAAIDGTSDASAERLGSVVVTAQSRAQDMQEVPIPLQIISAQQIENLTATDLSKMSLFVPGLVVGGDQPTQPSYQLRGISTSDFGIGTDSAVGVYVDGVYAARSGGALMAFNDVKRIEVLKGPQGTLFGRNAAAGAISIITNEPSDSVEGRARVRVGDFGTRYMDALLNLPAGEDMAFRFSAINNQSDGWVKDAASGRHYGGDDDWGTRAAWRWNVSDNTRVLLSWDHEKLNQLPKPAFGLIAMPADVNARPPYPADPAEYLNPLHAPLFNDAVGGAETRRFDGATLAIDHTFDWAAFTSTTAWRDFDTFNRGDYDGSNRLATYLDTTNVESNQSWYQEFKLSGNTRLMDWVAGASYYREHGRQTSQTNVFTDSIDTLAMNVAPAPTPDGSLYGFISEVLAANGMPYSLLGLPWREQISNQGNYTASALFGDVIWHLGDRLNLTTGVRVTRDEKRFTWLNAPRQADELDAVISGVEAAGVLDMIGIPAEVFQQNLIFTDAVGVPVTFKNRWNDVSPRLLLDYHFTPDLMGYASVTRGYKAGGYNSVQIASNFAPEKVWNYEAGMKTVFPDQNLLLNLSVYHYKYLNRQSLTLDPDTAGSGVPRYLVSSSDQKANGLEVEAQWQPLDALGINFSAAWIDATYGNTIAPSGANLSGQPTGEPKLSFASGLTYAWQDVLGGGVAFSVQHGWRGASRCNNDSILQGSCQITPNFSVGSAQQRTDVRLGWTAADGHWGAAVFVNNAFDKRYVTGINNITASVFGTPFASVTPPRLLGVELTAKF